MFASQILGTAEVDLQQVFRGGQCAASSFEVRVLFVFQDTASSSMDAANAPPGIAADDRFGVRSARVQSLWGLCILCVVCITPNDIYSSPLNPAFSPRLFCR